MVSGVTLCPWKMHLSVCIITVTKMKLKHQSRVMSRYVIPACMDSLSQHAQKDPPRSSYSPLLIYFTFTPTKSLQLFLVGILVSLRVPVHLAQRKFRQRLSLLEPSGSNVLRDKRQGALCTWLKEKGINLPTSLVTWDINHPINVGLSQLSI